MGRLLSSGCACVATKYGCSSRSISTNSTRRPSGEVPEMFNPAWVRQNPQDEKVALEFVYHDCPPDRLDWALSTRVTFYARRALEEPCALRAWPQVPSSYIMCTDDRTITPEWQRNAARELLGVEPIELPGGHCPHVSRPEALADALERIDNL